MLMRAWRLRLLSVGCLMIAGGVLPWVRVPNGLEHHTHYGALRLISLAAGVAVSLTALIRRAPKTSGAIVFVSGVVVGFFVLVAFGDSLWGPPLSIGMLFSAVGAAMGGLSGILLLVEGAASSPPKPQEKQHAGTSRLGQLRTTLNRRIWPENETLDAVMRVILGVAGSYVSLYLVAGSLFQALANDAPPLVVLDLDRVGWLPLLGGLLLGVWTGFGVTKATIGRYMPPAMVALPLAAIGVAQGHI